MNHIQKNEKEREKTRHRQQKATTAEHEHAEGNEKYVTVTRKYLQLNVEFTNT